MPLTSFAEHSIFSSEQGSFRQIYKHVEQQEATKEKKNQCFVIHSQLFDTRSHAVTTDSVVPKSKSSFI